MQEGRLLFARYAFMPNRLEFCGGPDSRALLDYCVAGRADAGLDGLIRQFQAAYPYLQFIARSCGIEDPLDARVVEAYWIGNDLLGGVDLRDFYGFIDDRFGPRIPERLKKYVVSKVPQGARPHHSFHVLDVSMRTGALDEDAKSLDKCRIGWGIVERLERDLVVVRSSPIVLKHGNLQLGKPEDRTASRRIDGKGYLRDLKPGDLVSLHWDWVCDLITPSQARSLERMTRYHLELANRTL